MNYCAEIGFDVLLTINKNLMFQQNLDLFPLTIAVLNCHSSKIEDLETFIPSFKNQLRKLEKHRAYIIEK